jgi:nicotinamide N-methyltransferase
MPITTEHRQRFDDDGFVILRDAFTQQRAQALRAAVEGLVSRAAAGDVEIRWIDADERVPDRTSHLLLPDKYDPAFGAWLDEDVAGDMEALLAGPLRHSLFGMLAAGGGRPYRQAWHRDLGKPGDPDEVEFLRRHHGRSVQFNAPVHSHDAYLQVVPGSHVRASTETENAVAQAGTDGTEPMPDAVTVELDPGDIVYYNANLWHRGWNPAGRMRWSLHSAYWLAEWPVMSFEHGQRDAFLTPGHLERLPGHARLLVERYVDSYTEDPPRLQDL